jgi:4-amino-4-deoxy-L-arabinose transferase-like glycosyltransferase
MSRPLGRALGVVRTHPDVICLLLVILAALAFKLGFALRIPAFIAKDSQAYFLPAYDLVHSGQFELGLRRTPGYPLFLAGALTLVGDDLRGILLLQHLLGVGTAALAFALGRLTFGNCPVVGRTAGLAAGLLTAISAPLVAYEHYLLAETLFAFVVTAVLVSLVWATRSGRGRLWLLGGLLVGLATMVKPIAQGFLPIALAGGYLAAARWRRLSRWASWPAPSRLALIAPGLLLTGYIVAIAPWTIRNQLAYNLATPSTFGRTLIARTASYDHGFTFVDPARPDADPRHERAARIVQQGAERGDSDGTIAQRLRQELDLDPIEVNALMRDLALQAIARQPLYFADGSLRFALRIFNGIEIRLRDHEAERRDVVWEDRTTPLLEGPRSDDDARAASQSLRYWQPSVWAPWPLVLFGLGVAMALTPYGRPGLLLGAMVAFLIASSAALNGPQERYRYPVDPAIAVLMAGGVASLVALIARLLARSRSGAPALPLEAQASSLALVLSQRERVAEARSPSGRGVGGEGARTNP